MKLNSVNSQVRVYITIDMYRRKTGLGDLVRAIDITDGIVSDEKVVRTISIRDLIFREVIS